MTDAHQEGREAASLTWCSEASCPYPINSKERLAWLNGFRSERNKEATDD